MERIRDCRRSHLDPFNIFNTFKKRGTDCKQSKLNEENVNLNQSKAKEESAGFDQFVTNFKEKKFTFVWRIENVHLSTIKNQEFLESPSFSTRFFGEVKWSLRFYPRGRQKIPTGIMERPPQMKHAIFIGDECTCKEKVGLFLNRISANLTDSSFRYSLSCERHILDSEGMLKEIHAHPRDGMTLIEIDPADSSEHGIDDFFCQSVYLYPETLVIKCDIHVTNISNKGALNNQVADLKSCTLFQDLKEMYETGKFSDVTLQVRNIKIPAHKYILASRSKVFDAMFQHNMKERQTNVVKIEGFEPAVLTSLLQYIYTGSLENFNMEKAMSLYPVANRYLLEELKNWCVDIMLENMTKGNVCQIAVLADLYPNPKLNEAVVNMFQAHASDIFKRREWQNLIRDTNHQALVTEILSAISTDFITNCKG